MFSLGLLLWQLCTGRHACHSRFVFDHCAHNKRGLWNHRLTLEGMFEDCKSSEEQTPFWLSDCSYCEQLKATLSDHPDLFQSIVKYLDFNPDSRVTPKQEDSALFKSTFDPDRHTSMPETADILQDATAPSWRDPSERKRACLFICDISVAMPARCDFLVALFQRFMRGSQGVAEACDEEPSERYRCTRELLMEYCPAFP
jgi:hypothetical protein